jgi:hypothetical protein
MSAGIAFGHVTWTRDTTTASGRSSINHIIGTSQ